MKIRFNKTLIESLKPPTDKERQIYYDTEVKGLMLQIFASGSSTFYLYRKFQGRPVKVKLGRYPDISVEKARKLAVKTSNELADGINPNEQKKAVRGDITFKDMFEEYMQRYSRKHKRSWKYDEREINKFLSHWFSKKASSISKQEVQRLHEKIREENGLYQANRILERIRAMYNKTIEWGWQGGNPAIGIKKFKEKSRDRFILPDELPRFIGAVEAEEDDTIRDFFLLSLLTGARKGNVLSMRFEDIDFTNNIWRIPETKSGEPVHIALVGRAVAILEARKQQYKKGFVFPSVFSKAGHLQDPKRAWQRILKRAEIENLRIHDIRRTLGSYQAITGASMQVIGKSLGHKSQHATQIYSRLDLDPIRYSLDKAIETIFNLAKPKKEKQPIIKLDKKSQICDNIEVKSAIH
jgi:integrase